MNDRKLLSFFITIQRNNPLDLVDSEYYPDEGWDEFDPRDGWQNANSDPLADIRAAAKAILDQQNYRRLEPVPDQHIWHSHIEEPTPPKVPDFTQLKNSITAMQRNLRIGMSNLARQWAAANPAASQIPIATAPKVNPHRNTSRKKQNRRKKKGRHR